MSWHNIDYDDTQVWGRGRQSHWLEDEPTAEELQDKLDLNVCDARVWAEGGHGEDDLECMFGFVIGEDTDEAVGITEFDRHRRLAELHMSAAMLHKKLGDGSTFDENEAAIGKMKAEEERDDRIDRRAAVMATRGKGKS